MRKMLIAPALAATAALVLVGCAAPATPKQVMGDALTKTGQGKNMTVTMKLDTTADDLKKLVTAMGDSGATDQSAQTIEAITSIVPKVAVKTSLHSNGGDLNVETDPSKIDGSFAITVDSKPLEVLWVKSKAYLHADVDGIGQATGLFTGTQVKMMAASAAKTMPWITPLVEGKWVAIDDAIVTKYIEKVKETMASASPSAKSSVDMAKASAAFLEASEITKVDDTTFKIVTDAKKLIKAAAAMDANDELTDAKADEAIAKINDGANLDTTVTLKNGAVSKVVIDLADVMRTWAKPDASQPVIAKLAATDFKLGGVFEFDSADMALAAPAAAATIPASDLDNFGGV